MKSVCVAIVSLLGLVTAVTSTDYCAPELCYIGPHIGCRNNGTLGPACPRSGFRILQITNALKTKIADIHNSKRNFIANGKLQGFQPAARMGAMQWNDELALLALYNVKTCMFQHDRCHNTNEFKASGQNLGMTVWSGTTYDINRVTLNIFNLIDAWWEEHKNASMSQIRQFPSYSPNVIGHFTVMATESNVAVGCATICFPRDDTATSQILACNYATTNIIGAPVYIDGSTGSKCTSGRDLIYPALCSASEKYSVNEF